MNKLFLTLSLLLFSCNKNNVNWYKGEFQEALESSNKKIVMVDFYADW